MKTRHQSLLFVIGALAIAATAYAQVPSSNDTSDGNQNTGMGTGALGLTGANGGSFNTASGYDALLSNTTGFSNTATGYKALQANMIGSNNTGVGVNVLFNNNGGTHNTASGVQALFSNTHGNQNTASGFDALFLNKTGNFNTGLGYESLFNETTGTYNVALGWEAGYLLTTGSNNIDIGNQGAAGDSWIIRIGTTNMSVPQAAYVAGIYYDSISDANPRQVYVTSAGQLGFLTSSERFKTAITPMGSTTARLDELRPVTFHLKNDPNGTLQYGLIAEEVAKVYPELVIRDYKGTISGVRYDVLAPMLLNEVQKQKRAADAQAQQLRDVKQQLADMQAAFASFKSKGN